ncbi:integrin alpha-4-like [Limulus polyphemus]|uniref:Integrin alpha-4-like n=1 Tax=Limulus polyphemus TaxID=6850 RepID=A0ABM1TKY0_LIMPO|nr:integrin alpha-4-like [Limulus polyphemus]
MAFNQQTATSRTTSQRFSVEFSIRSYWLFVILIFTVHNVCGFNVDTKFPVIFRNSAWNSENTNFGFSVAFHRNDAAKMILVTAPKANGSAFGSDVIEPGILYKCIFIEGKSTTTCNEVEIDTTGNENEVKKNEFVSYKDLKNNMWFGVSMDVQHQGQNNVVVCGHLWKNQQFLDYWANGVCYLLNKDLILLKENKYLPLVDRCTGLGYEVEESGQLGQAIIPDPIYVYRNYPYIGYSVTTGKFFKLSETESLVLGAPRDSDTRGKVYIISGYAFFTSKSFKEEARFEGSQMGEYFGATVLAVNLNNDKYSDLLVGAPLFSLEGGSE